MNTSLITMKQAGAIAMAAALTSCFVESPVPAHLGHTQTVYAPGYSVTTLPSGYETVTYRGNRYYKHGGVWYQTRGSSYVVVQTPY